MSKTTTATEGRDLILTRVIAAPRERVYRAGDGAGAA